jgi:hypothetical protein
MSAYPGLRKPFFNFYTPIQKEIKTENSFKNKKHKKGTRLLVSITGKAVWAIIWEICPAKRTPTPFRQPLQHQ